MKSGVFSLKKKQKICVETRIFFDSFEVKRKFSNFVEYVFNITLPQGKIMKNDIIYLIKYVTLLTFIYIIPPSFN